MIGETVDSVGQTVVAYVYKNEQILSPGRFVQDALGFSRSKPGTFAVQQIGVGIMAAGQLSGGKSRMC